MSDLSEDGNHMMGKAHGLRTDTMLSQMMLSHVVLKEEKN